MKIALIVLVVLAILHVIKRLFTNQNSDCCCDCDDNDCGGDCGDGGGD